MKNLKMHSKPLVQDNILRIREIFPDCVTEALDEDGNLNIQVNFEKLQQELSGSLVEGQQERYQLNWPGKREAILNSNTPITKALRPIQQDSSNFADTKNIYIEGDNLEIIKLLQESYLGKIKMIYIDPPYNTGKDIIYKNDYSESDKDYKIAAGEINEQGMIAISNPETSGKYHSNWLSMMYPLLKCSRNLLTDDGMIVIAIDHFELANLVCICDEIYGYRNRVGLIAIRNNPAGRSTATGVSITHEYALIYSKSEDIQLGRLPRNDKQIARYGEEDDIGAFEWVNFRKPGSKRSESPKMYYPIFVSSNSIRIPNVSWNAKNNSWDLLEQPSSIEKIIYPIDDDGKDRRWRWAIERAKTELSELAPKVMKGGEHHVYLKGRMPNDGVLPSTWWDKKEYSSTAYGTNLLKDLFGELQVFSYPKSLYAVKDLIEICAPGANDIVLDFFSGSATTAHAVLELNAEKGTNKQFILAQLPVETKFEGDDTASKFTTICEIGKERIRRAAKKIQDETGAEIDYGFRVYRLDSSNMEDVYYQPNDYDQSKLDMFSDNVKSDRTADDLLAQVIIDWGLQLSMKIEKKIILSKDVYFVEEDSLVACFESSGGIDEAFVKELAKHKPLRIVFRDSGFKNDAMKISVEQIIKSISPHSEVRTI